MDKKDEAVTQAIIKAATIVSRIQGLNNWEPDLHTMGSANTGTETPVSAPITSNN